MGKTRRFEKDRWSDEKTTDVRKKMPVDRKQKRIKNALRQNNINELLEHEEEY